MDFNKITNLNNSVDDTLSTDVGSFFGEHSLMGLDRLKNRANNYAMPNRFIIRFAIPKTISEYYNSDKSELIMGMARDVVLPSTRLGTFEHRDQGVVRKLPNDVIYTNVSAAFYVDGDMLVRQFFQDWINTVTTSNTKSFNYLDEYSSNIQISQLNQAGKIVYTCELVDAYPVNLGEIQLSAESNNQLMVQNVGFSYHTWREINPETLDDYTLGGLIDSNVDGGLAALLTDSLGISSRIDKRIDSAYRTFL